MTAWKKETDFTTAKALHESLSSAPSKVNNQHVHDNLSGHAKLISAFQYHDPSLSATEEEILSFFRSFGNFLNVVSRTDVAAGKKFFDLQDYTIWDIMGTLHRGNLEPHYDHITPYLGHTNQQFRELEIIAVTPTFGYITANQRVDGTASDGTPYDFTYRSTSIVRKVEGEWKYLHEHYSFPVDMATKQADTTCSQVLSESVEFKKKENN